jgi:hypothetical protein
MRKWNQYRRRGLGLPELLISLAITASLLTATAVALSASTKAYKVNEEQSSLIQRARLTLNRLTATIRVNRLHQPHTPAKLAQFAGGTTVIDTGIDMYDGKSNTLVSFNYDSTTQRVIATVNNKPHILAEGVTQFQITLEPMRSPESIRTGGGWDLLRRATIQMSIRTVARTAVSSETTGTQVITLTDAIMPRRNTW